MFWRMKKFYCARVYIRGALLLLSVVIFCLIYWRTLNLYERVPRADFAVITVVNQYCIV